MSGILDSLFDDQPVAAKPETAPVAVAGADTATAPEELVPTAPPVSLTLVDTTGLSEKERLLLDLDQLKNQIAPIAEEAGKVAVSITDQASFERANEFVVKINEAEKAILKTWGPRKDAHYQAWKDICAVLKPLSNAKERVDQMLLDYRRREQKRLQAEADEKARIAREEQERIAQAAAETAAAESERLRVEAEKAAQSGDLTGAAALAEEAQGQQALAENITTTPAPEPVSVKVEAPQAKGASVRSYTTAKVTSLKILVASIASGQVPLEAVIPNQTWLNEQFKKNPDLKWPGVEADTKEGFARSRK